MTMPTRITKEMADAAYAIVGAKPKPNVTLRRPSREHREEIVACPIGALAAAYCDVQPPAVTEPPSRDVGFFTTCTTLISCENAPVQINANYANNFAAGFDGREFYTFSNEMSRQGYEDGVALRLAYGFRRTPDTKAGLEWIAKRRATLSEQNA